MKTFTDNQGNPLRDAPGFGEFRQRLHKWEEREREKLAQKWFQLETGEENTKFGVQEAKDLILGWIDEKQQGPGEMRWFEFRMDAVNAIKYTYGIGHIGPSEILTVFGDQEFDEEGVMKN